jgi:poly(3-hydroxybutyrate) depolymerase
MLHLGQKTEIPLNGVKVSSQKNAARAHGTLSNGCDSFVFPHSGKNITVWYYNPGITPTTPVVFVMHGVKRNGQKYRDSWVEYAQKRRFLVLVPEFSKERGTRGT